MPINIKFDQEKNILYATTEGKIAFAEFESAMKTILSAKEYPPNVRTFWDLRNIDVSSIDANFEMMIISLRKKFPERGNAKLCLLVDSDLSFGLSRMYQMLSDNLPQTIRIFRNYSDAEQWLLKDE